MAVIALAGTACVPAGPQAAPSTTSALPVPIVPQGPALGAVERTSGVAAPVLPNVSDPSVLTWQGQYYIYASDHLYRSPVTIVDDIDERREWMGWFLATREAMPERPTWAAQELQAWAPTVARFGDRWIMFFGADRVDPPQPHNAQCIGRAYADDPAGPFVPDPQPWDCGIDGVGGALDPEVFTDVDGSRWLLLTYSDTEAPIRSVRLDANGDRVGSVNTILERRWPWEYWFIENPSMLADPLTGTYILTYSAGHWTEPGYSTGVARCTSPAGPCTSDSAGPWVSSGQGRTGTGGFTFFTDLSGRSRAMLSSWPEGSEGTGHRAASVLDVELSPVLVSR